MQQNTIHVCLKKKSRMIASSLCAVMLCMSLLCESASAAYLVVINLADIVDQTVPSVVEVFTETKQVSQLYREYVIQGAGSGVILLSREKIGKARVEEETRDARGMMA